MVQVTTTVVDSTSAFDVLWIGASEVLATLWDEALLFGVAALVYVATVYLRPLSLTTTKQKVQSQRGGVQERRRQGSGEKQAKSAQNDASAKAVNLGDANGPPKYVKEIQSFGKSKDLKGAVAAFENQLRDGGVVTSLLYKAIMDACVECGDVNAAAAYFALAKEKGLIDVVNYNILIKGRLAAGEMECAERLLSELQQEGLTATPASFHGLLNARVLAGDLRGAWCIIDQMQAAGLTPNTLTCSILLKGVSARCHSADLLRIAAFTDAMETYMDRSLLASLVEGCLRTGQGELALKTLQKVRGDDLALAAPTYGAMIKFFGQTRDVERIWVVWREMHRQGVKVTAITVGCMIEALVANGRAHDAWKLVRQIWEDEEQRALVNTITYSTLLKGFLRQPQKVLCLYQEMKDCGIECNAVTYNTILNVFSQNGDMKHVPAILDAMAACTPPVEPDVVTYATLIKGYCSSGDVDRASKLFDDMKGVSRVAPDDVTYHCLLDGFAKAHRVDDALRLYDDMISSGLAPSNYTLSILVKLLGRSKRLNQAFSLVETVTRDHDVQPNIQVYTCMMQACFQNRQVGKAVALLDRLLEEGLQPDERTYSALVQGCLAGGQINKALELAKRSLQEGRPVGVDTKALNALTAKAGKENATVQSVLAATQRLRQTNHQ